MDINEILAKAELAERTEYLCLRGSLVGRFEELAHRLQTASTKPQSLGEPAEATVIAREMETLRAEMQSHEVPFKLRALSPKAWRDFFALMPQIKPDGSDADTYDERFHAWVCQLVAVVCYEPEMTAEQASALSEKLSPPQWKQLTGAAWDLNAERQNIPFSAAASAMTLSSEQSSRRPEPGESPTPASSARSGQKSPRTSTTKRATSRAR